MLMMTTIWRVPERRSRYLPASLVLVGLMCFAAGRTISFHYVDSLLYRRDIGGVRLVAPIELLLLSAAVASASWFPFTDSGGPQWRAREPVRQI